MRRQSLGERPEATIPVLRRRFGSWRICVGRAPFSPSELRRRYDGAAPGWDRLLARLGFPTAYEALFRGLLAEEGLDFRERKYRVLDSGVGTGAASAALLAALGGVPAAGLELHAVDLSSRMLERAATNLRQSRLTVSLHRHDMRTLPLDDDVFDLAITAHALEHLGQPRVALREIVRVLKPGGLAVACLTRRSLLGAVVHLKHRTHGVTNEDAEHWFLDSGFVNVHSRSFGRMQLCNWLSVACVGTKPLVADSERSPVSGRSAACEGDGGGASRLREGESVEV